MTQNKCALVIKCKFGFDHVSSYSQNGTQRKGWSTKHSEGNHENEL